MFDIRQYGRLLERMEGRLAQDQYGRHTIMSLYYDTDDFAVIRRCLDKPRFRQKLRLRSYGVPNAGSIVYLELKKKMSGITYKRRVPLALSAAQQYMAGGLPPDDGQIFGEIDWFVKRQPLCGKALICYDRIAMTGVEDPNLRVTFDFNVRWRGDDLCLSKGDYGSPLLSPSMCLMEVKTLNALPLWLVNELSSLSIYPSNFSKYGTVFAQFLGRKEEMRHAV